MISLEEPFFSTGAEDIYVDRYIEGVARTLTFWLLIHLNARWSAEYMLDAFGQWEMFVEDPKKVTLFNGDSVDISESLSKFYAEDLGWKFYDCPECGVSFDSTCDECGAEDLEEITGDEYAYYASEYLYDFSNVSRRAWVKAYEEALFPAYRESVAPLVEGVLEGIIDAIMDMVAMANAGNLPELLAATMAATQVYHVNGEVIEDYGDYQGIYASDVRAVRDGSFEEQFGEEAVTSFLEGKAPDIYLSSDLIEVIRLNGDEQQKESLDKIVHEQIKRRFENHERLYNQ